MRQGIGWRCPRSTSYASTTRRANHQFKYRHIQANTTVFRNLFIYYEWSYNTYIVQERSANSNKDYDNAKCKIRSHTSFCVATPATVSKPKLWRVQLWQLSNLDWKLTGANNIPSVSSVWYSQLEVCRLSSRCRRSPHTQTSSLVEWLQPSDDMYHISEYHRRNGDRIPDGWAEQSQPRTAGTGSVRGPTLEELPHRTNVGTNLNAPQRTKRVRPSTYDVNHAKTHPRKPYRTSLNAAAEWRELPVLCQIGWQTSYGVSIVRSPPQWPDNAVTRSFTVYCRLYLTKLLMPDFAHTFKDQGRLRSSGNCELLVPTTRRKTSRGRRLFVVTSFSDAEWLSN